jgi:uncharacterized delta-60 repeat protein
MKHKLWKQTATLLIIINFLLPIHVSAQAGALDITFGTGGKVITNLGSTDESIYSLAIQTDGKILVAGYSDTEPYSKFALARYDVDGNLDVSFGMDGIVLTDILSTNGTGHSIAIQADNKIVVSGHSYAPSGIISIALVRYNSDGTLDETFDTDGIVITTLSNSTDIGYAVVIQDDGKILVAGYTSSDLIYDFVLLRYNSDGSLDDTFGIGGYVTADLNVNSDIANSIALQEDGKIILAGYSYNGLDDDVAIVRYNSDGSLDSTFDYDGKVSMDFDDTDQHIYSVGLQSSGKIVVAGSSWSESPVFLNFALARYNSDGSLDDSFGDAGFVLTAFNDSWNKILSLSIQDDDKIVVAGYAFNGEDDDFAVARYNADGSLDNSFDFDGKVSTDVAGFRDWAYAVKIQNDSKIVVVGNCMVSNPDFDFALVRYLGDEITGISETELTDPSISISPNPFSSEFNIIAKIPGEIILYDMLGNEIQKQQVNIGENLISSHLLPPGIYLVNYFDGENREGYKIVKY